MDYSYHHIYVEYVTMRAWDEGKSLKPEIRENKSVTL